VPTNAEIAKQYLEMSMANDVDGALALLTDDVVLDRPMLGPASGKDAVADSMRNPPAGFGGITPTFDQPEATGDQVKVKATLPPGLPVATLTWIFNFADGKISRIQIAM
jgi:ketosteroid isomerase-like protein